MVLVVSDAQTLSYIWASAQPKPTAQPWFAECSFTHSLSTLRVRVIITIIVIIIIHPRVLPVPSCRSIGPEQRLLGQRRHARAMPGLITFIVPRRIIDGNSIVPQRAGTRRSAKAYLDVDVSFIHVVEVVEQDVAFGSVQADDAVRHGPVDP